MKASSIWAAMLATAIVPASFGQGAVDYHRFIVIGCITKPSTPPADPKNAELLITDYRGGPTPVWRLDANDTRLTPWINHTVEIAGRIVAGSKSKETPPTYKLNVDKVSEIARGCGVLEKPEDR